MQEERTWPCGFNQNGEPHGFSSDEQDLPMMYKGWVLNKNENGLFGAWCPGTGKELAPIYRTWEALKSVIDALK